MPEAAVLTISDRCAAGQAEDNSGPLAEEILREFGFQISDRDIVSDDVEQIRAAVRRWIDRCVALVVTTGGTGISERDVTPEAIGPLLTKLLPGFGEIMRVASFNKTPFSIISRGGAGIARQTLVVMLPGSPKGVRESLAQLGPAIRHVVQFLTGAVLEGHGPA
jgi:molybdenum cofactor synthesis domain-containing protein